MKIELNLLVIRCNKLEDSKLFYSQLGLDFVSEKHGNGPTHYSTSLGSLVIELYQAMDVNEIGNSRHGFHYKNVNIEEMLRANGISILNTIQRDNKLLIHVVADPDGRKIELCVSRS